MSTEQNKAVVRRFIEETLNAMDSSLVDELFAPDYTNHMVPGGREGFKQFFSMVSSAYPDLKMKYSVERLMAEGDYVMMRASMHISNNGKEVTGCARTACGNCCCSLVRVLEAFVMTKLQKGSAYAHSRAPRFQA